MLNLSSYLTNPHLARLFTATDEPCAIQLWALLAKSKKSDEIVKSVVYGRVVPYSSTNHKWSFSHSDKYQDIDEDSIKVTRLNLFTSSQNTKELFKYLCDGLTLSEVSEKLELNFDERFRDAFGDLTLNSSELVFQPVEYLLNKAAYEQSVLDSPHENAGAISAAIGQTNKLHLVDECSANLENNLLAYIAEKLNEDTGLDFLGKDKDRLGNIEFLVFPSLDDKERTKFAVNPNREKQLISIELASAKGLESVKFQFLIKLYNKKKLIYSALQMVGYCEVSNAYIAEFQVGSIASQIYDCIEVETYSDNGTENFILYDRWRMSYIREVSFNMHLVGSQHQPVKLDWLEKKVRPKYTSRAQAVLTLDELASEATAINSREKEHWVSLNREFIDKVELLKPQSSKGRFFLRYGPTQGEGSLEFVKWFKELFYSSQRYHIVIFDPYFEGLGLSLIKLYGAQKSSYTVFTSYPKNEEKDGSRYNNLLRLCKQNSKQLSAFNLKILGLKEGKLHDRYILVVNSDSIPVQGFHLSNSLQAATVKQPLLITPIPQDVLLEVTSYMLDLLQQSTRKKEIESEIKTLFDSGQIAEEVSEQLVGANGLDNDSPLSDMNDKELINWFNTVKATDFEEQWPLAALSLAKMPSSSYLKWSGELPNSFVSQLEAFFNQTLQHSDGENEESISVIVPRFYAAKLDTLLNLNIELVLRQPSMKTSNLSWPEYFSVKLLWRYKPQVLFDAIEDASKKSLPDNFRIDASNIKYYTMLSQALNEINLSIIVLPTSEKVQKLLHNDNAVLQWLGINMLNQLSIQEDKPKVFFSAIQSFPLSRKITFSGWFLLQHKNQKSEEFLQEAIAKFLQLLPEKLNKQDLTTLLDSLRGHMKSLAYNGFWVYEKILQPLLIQNRIVNDDLVSFWFEDLKQGLPLCNVSGESLFSNSYQGELSNLTAYFYAHSKTEQQEKITSEIVKLQRQMQKIVHQPLASTIDYKKWSAALDTALWLKAFVTMVKLYQLQGEDNSTFRLESINAELNKITQLRTQAEWQQYPSELVSFYYQTQKMLERIER